MSRIGLEGNNMEFVSGMLAIFISYLELCIIALINETTDGLTCLSLWIVSLIFYHFAMTVMDKIILGL